MRKSQYKKIAFLDRDGVINLNPPPHQYVTRVEDFVLNPGIVPLLKELKRRGFELIVVTNQRGIARGLMTEEILANIHTQMRDSLREHDVELLDIFHCPHEIGTCRCRKPKPGLLEQAAAKYNIDRSRSILISDTEDDVRMGHHFGLKWSILVPQNTPLEALKELRIRIAFVKFGGLSAGGTEKFLQIIAANLNKDEFAVDYFYCEGVPYIGSTYKHPTTDSYRVAYMKERGVNVIEFKVGAKDLTTPTHVWRDTDFWEKFDERNYDMIQMGRGGHKEYPFTKIRHTPLVDSIHLSAGVDNQPNIARVMHICQWSADRWVRTGGDKSRIALVSLPLEMPAGELEDLRTKLGLDDKFVYGMHQRPDDAIFSPFPLEAYGRIEDGDTAFVMLGGGAAYQRQVKELGLKNVYFLPATGDINTVCSFLKTLNVYAHGRKDGEVNSQAMAEAMYFGLPIVSHPSAINNGHLECIGEAGTIHESIESYANEMLKLKEDSGYYEHRSKAARDRFKEKYELHGQIRNFERIYREIYEDPFPNPFRRLWSSLHWTQNLRIWVKWPYLKIKYVLNGKV